MIFLLKNVKKCYQLLQLPNLFMAYSQSVADSTRQWSFKAARRYVVSRFSAVKWFLRFAATIWSLVQDRSSGLVLGGVQTIICRRRMTLGNSQKWFRCSSFQTISCFAFQTSVALVHSLNEMKYIIEYKYFFFQPADIFYHITQK